MRKLQGKYGLAFSISKELIKIVFKSPIFNWKDIIPLLVAFSVNKKILAWMWSYNLYEHGKDYWLPVYYLLGDSDNHTPVHIAEEYFKQIKVPGKELFLVNKAGHLPMLDNLDDYAEKLGKIIEKCTRQEGIQEA